MNLTLVILSCVLHFMVLAASFASTNREFVADYPSCLGNERKYYQDVVNSVFMATSDCNTCVPFYYGPPVRMQIPIFYYSSPPAMYQDIYVRLINGVIDDERSDKLQGSIYESDVQSISKLGRGSIYPEGYQFTHASRLFDWFNYQHLVKSMKSYIHEVAMASYYYKLPENLFLYLTGSQLDGYHLYSFSLWKKASLYLQKHNYSQLSKVELLSQNSSNFHTSKLLGHNLFDMTSPFSNTAEGGGETAVGIILEAHESFRHLILELQNDLATYASSNNGKARRQIFSDFCSNESNIGNSDFIAFFSALFNLEATIQLDAAWINTYLIIGYLKSSLPSVSSTLSQGTFDSSSEVYRENDALFCDIAKDLLPKLFSVIINCSSYAISHSYSQSDHSTTCYLNQSTCDDANPKFDVVRNELTKLYFHDKHGNYSSSEHLQRGVSIDYFVYLNDKSNLPGEGWLRSAIRRFMYSNSYSAYGVALIQALGTLTVFSTDSFAISTASSFSSSIIMSRSFLSPSIYRRRHGADHDIVNLVFRSNQTRLFNDLALLLSLDHLNILKWHNGSFINIESTRIGKEVDVVLESEAFRLADVLVDSITERFFWADEEVNKKKNDVRNPIDVNKWKTKSKLHLIMEEKRNISRSRIAYITAVFGDYESSCKRHAFQTVSSDFICFTDNPNIIANNWVVDETPYHLQFLESEVLSNFSYFTSRGITIGEIRSSKNMYINNIHPFNVAKFYKTNFHWIPRLKEYDVIVWVDGTIALHNSMVSSHILRLIDDRNESIITFEQERWGKLKNEMEMSLLHEKYTTDNWNNIKQPLQKVDQQYEAYLLSGYDDSDYWGPEKRFEQIHASRLTEGQLNRHQRGVFCTCFIAWDMRRQESRDFLALWYEQILFFSTQDQISFPFVAQKLGSKVFSLPDDSALAGNYNFNEWFEKMDHGN